MDVLPGMTPKIDWKALYQVINDAAADAREGGANDAERAVELIIGEPRLRQAVDDYVGGHETSELIRAVLALFHPRSAITRCHEVYLSGAGLAVRRRAVELMQAIADRAALQWVPDLLADPDIEIRRLGIGVLDHLVRQDLVWPEDCEPVLERAKAHDDWVVRARAAALSEYLATRARGSQHDASA